MKSYVALVRRRGEEVRRIHASFLCRGPCSSVAWKVRERECHFRTALVNEGPRSFSWAPPQESSVRRGCKRRATFMQRGSEQVFRLHVLWRR